MTIKFHFSVLILFCFTIIGIQDVYAPTLPSLNYDLDLIDLEILDIQVLPIDDTPKYPYDDSDLIKITIAVENINVETFILNDKMFKIHVIENMNSDTIPGYDVTNIVDNYYTSWDAELEVRYDNFFTREL